jgi:hypothetical protein
MLDCPISGTGAQAAAGDIAIYASGDRRAFNRCQAVLNGFSRSTYYCGEFGVGSKLKFVANLLVTIHNLSTAEAMVVGEKAGLDLDLLYRVIGDGAGSSRMFQVRGPLMVAGRYLPAHMKSKIYQKGHRYHQGILQEPENTHAALRGESPVLHGRPQAGLGHGRYRGHPRGLEKTRRTQGSKTSAGSKTSTRLASFQAGMRYATKPRSYAGRSARRLEAPPLRSAAAHLLLSWPSRPILKSRDPGRLPVCRPAARISEVFQ